MQRSEENEVNQQDDVQQLRTENAALQQAVSDLKAQSVPRHEFEELKDVLLKLQSQPPRVIPSAPSTAMKEVTRFKMHVAMVTGELAKMKKELSAATHATQCLNHRYNNLTSATLAWQIARILNPVSPELLRQCHELTGRSNEFSRRVDFVEAAQSSRIDSLEKQLDNHVTQNSDEKAVLKAGITGKASQATIEELKAAIRASDKEHNKRYTSTHQQIDDLLNENSIH